MKKYPTIIVLLFCLIIMSCQKENDFTNDEKEINLDYKVDTKTSKSNLIESQTRGSAIELILFEKRMQWASFITAKVLINNPNIQTKFTAMLSNNVDTIPFEELIGNYITDPDLVQFKENFILYTEDFMDYINRSSKQLPTKDDPTPVFPVSHPMEENDISLSAQQFLTFFTDHSCVELYFPNGVIFNDSFSISSTSHPLIGGIEDNYGFKRNQTDQHNLIASTIDDYYVNQNSNIIVARPVRDLSPICDYDEFSSVEDFTDFLSN